MDEENKFTWVPFYKELSRKLLGYELRQNELIGLLKNAGIRQNKKEELSLTEITPSRFYYYIHKHRNKERLKEIFTSIKEALEIKSPLPESYPEVEQAFTLFNGYDIPNSWDILKLVNNGNEIDKVNLINCFRNYEKDVSDRINGFTFLTFFLFFIKPDKYIPFDPKIAYEKFGLLIETNNIEILWTNYISSFRKMREFYSEYKSSLYQIYYKFIFNDKNNDLQKQPTWIPFYQRLAQYFIENEKTLNDGNLFHNILKRSYDTLHVNFRNKYFANDNYNLGKKESLNPIMFFCAISKIDNSESSTIDIIPLLNTTKNNMNSILKDFKYENEIKDINSLIYKGEVPNLSIYYQNSDDKKFAWELFHDAFHLNKESGANKFLDLYLYSKKVRGVDLCNLTWLLYILHPTIFAPYNKETVKELELSKNGTVREYCEVFLPKVKSYCRENNNIEIYDFVNAAYSNLKRTDTKTSKDYSNIGDKTMQHKSLNTILYGAPGTGKTWNTTDRAVAIVDKKEFEDNIDENKHISNLNRFNELLWNAKDKTGQICFLTFHQSYSYEEFVEGIKPKLIKNNENTDNSHVSSLPNNKDKETGDVEYEIKAGIFKELCEKAKNDPNIPKNNYVLIIDEINRGNVSRIFGELITLIETDKREKVRDDEDDKTQYNTLRVTLPYSKVQFSVPNNLYIIGTMNTADRSIEALDTALRRRFSFVEYEPDCDLLKDTNVNLKVNNKSINIKILLEKINERIEVLYDRDHRIGHSYFLNLKDGDSREKLVEVFQNSVIPLLQEYFFSDWGKIRLILGDSFIKKVTDKTKFAIDVTDNDYSDKEIYRLRKSDEPGAWKFDEILESKQETKDN